MRGSDDTPDRDGHGGSTLSRRNFLRNATIVGGAAVVAPGVLLQACAPASSSPAPAASAASLAPTLAPSVAPSGSSTVGIKSGGILKAAITGEPETLDPAKANIYASHQVFGHIFDPLVQVDENGEFYGALAREFTSPDPKTWIFDLRDDVVFHNGEKFSADDVKYSVDRILDPATASPWANLLAPVESVQIESPSRIVFHLKETYGPFLTYLAQHGYIVNKKAIEAGDPTRSPVGTGPFSFVEWVQGDHVRVKKFDKYFLTGQPYLDEVDFRFRLVDESRIQALRSDELDWIDAIPLPSVASVKNDPAFTFVTSAIAGVADTIMFNTKAPPFDNKALRQAVAWATDRQQITDIAYFGTGEAATQEVGTASPLHDGVDPWPGAPNVDTAKAKLAEAGVDPGLKVEIISLPQYPGLLKTAEVLQQNLKAIGLDASIIELDVPVWVDRATKGDFQVLTGSYSGAADPDIIHFSFIHSKGGVNWSGYNSPQTDQLIDQARAEPDVTKRRELYAQLRKIIADDVPIFYPHYESVNYLMDKPVLGSTINPILTLRFEDVGFSA